MEPDFNKYAAFALDVYREQDRPTLPDGWEVYEDYKPGLSDIRDDYFGSFYIKKQSMPPAGEVVTEIIFAHRGTMLTVDDLLSDLNIALGEIPGQYAKARKFYDDTIEKLKNDFPQQKESIALLISQTGHSLGAILAELTFVATVSEPSELQKEVSFESPGSKTMMQSMMDEGTLPQQALDFAKENCSLLFTHVDIVNTCNEQVTDIFFQAPVSYNYSIVDGPTAEIPSEVYENIYYIVGYSFCDQHKMKKIYDFLSTAPAQVVDTWPFGLQHGYDQYRTYDINHDYWDQYIKICWDTHPEMHDTYQNDYNKYFNYFLKRFLLEPVEYAERFLPLSHASSSALLACHLHALPPLHEALAMGNPGLAERLLRQGADPNQLSSMGESPLHIVAKQKDIVLLERFIQLLIDYKVDLCLKNSGGKLPEEEVIMPKQHRDLFIKMTRSDFELVDVMLRARETEDSRCAIL